MHDMLSPIVQYGFAGLCAVLLGIIVWLIKELLVSMRDTRMVLDKNNQVIADLSELTRDMLKLNRDVHDKILARPCIARKEDGR